MGRGKHCTHEKRDIIKKMVSEQKSYSEIRRIVGCSNKMIVNALKYTANPENRGRKKVLSPLMVNRLVRESKKDPFKPATELKKELNITASVETVRRRLRDNNLNACSPRKVPLLSHKHVVKRLQFANSHLNWAPAKWRNVLWTDESKIVLFGGRGSRCYVRRPPNAEFNPNYTTKTIKHGGSSIMVWACFSYYGVGPIHWIRSIMDKTIYVNILQEVMLPYASEEMPLVWVFQQDNDPKHTRKLEKKKWFQDNNINVMEWPAQSPDLNPIENLWTDIKKGVAQIKPTSNEALWTAVVQIWNKISVERCQNLVNSMTKRCAEVIANKGHATKY